MAVDVMIMGMSKPPLDYATPDSQPKRKHQVRTILFWIVALPILIILALSFIGRLMGR